MTPLRHFPYKHPTFGTTSRPKPKSAWESTIYFWWWAYLKRNSAYLQCCEMGGIGELASLYMDFGDVRGDDFKAWWTEGGRGVLLFAEPSAEASVRVLEEGEAAPSRIDMLTVSLPLYLPKRYLQRRVAELLAAVHGGKRGKLMARTSKAKYRFSGQPNIPALRQGLMVYDALKACEGIQPKKPYWKIAMDLKLVEARNRVHASDSPAIAADKRNVMTAIVGRYKKRVSESIQNVARGVFP